jgi:sec-independent protein translocase protein TatB
MFDIGFSEVLLIFVIALVVLGPEKLPRLASQVGRWVGRARAMARQFREQLEEEVNLEEVRRTQAKQKPVEPAPYTPPPPATETQTPAADTTVQAPVEGQPTVGVDPADLRADTFAHGYSDTFSHAHPTNEHGANPLTPNGAPDAPPAPGEAYASDTSPTEPASADASKGADNHHKHA